MQLPPLYRSPASRAHLADAGLVELPCLGPGLVRCCGGWSSMGSSAPAHSVAFSGNPATASSSWISACCCWLLRRAPQLWAPPHPQSGFSSTHITPSTINTIIIQRHQRGGCQESGGGQNQYGRQSHNRGQKWSYAAHGAMVCFANSHHVVPRVPQSCPKFVPKVFKLSQSCFQAIPKPKHLKGQLGYPLSNEKSTLPVSWNPPRVSQNQHF